MLDTRLLVFPTGRAIRAYEETPIDTFLPAMVTAESFFNNSIVVPGKKRIPSELRSLLLQQACEKLQIGRFGFKHNLLDFMEHATFLFPFFDELSGESVEIQEIYLQDTYAEYEEHLSLLEEIKSAYIKILEEYHYFDRSTIDNYELNHNYLQHYSSIHFFLEGYLTKRELSVLNQISEIIPVVLDFHATAYSSNMLSKLSDYGISMGREGHYLINLDKKHSTPQDTAICMPQFHTASFSNRVLQANYIFAQIRYYIEEEQIAPSKIAVILPTESYVSHLKLFDEYRNLNFAMGKAFAETGFYQKLSLLKTFLDTDAPEEMDAQLQTMELQPQAQAFSQAAKSRDLTQFLTLLEPIFPGNIQEKSIVDECLYHLKHFAYHMSEYTVQDYLSLFLKILETKNLDDIGGGKVTVMGVLETRGIHFDAIIMPDMNEGIVPKPNEKDIFLNSAIRKRIGLPTRKERENLQKHYYLRLLQRTKFASLCWLHNEENHPSRFLEEININVKENSDDKYKQVFFPFSRPKTHWNAEIELEIDLTQTTFSHSRFKIFLECKRRYYYQYICALQEPSLPPVPKPYELGNLVHLTLKDMYESDLPGDLKTYKKTFADSLLAKCDHEILIFEANLLLESIDPFIQNELERLQCGHTLLALEDSFPDDFSIEDVAFTGRIDRLDCYENSLEIIDYKVKNEVKIDNEKNMEKTTDFQLEIYRLAMQQKYPSFSSASTYYYDIRKGTLLHNPLVEEKTAHLRHKLEALREKTIHFSKQDERPSLCHQCPYRILCDK